MLLKWLPWKFLARRVCRSKGFLDPVNLLARLGKFSQPSEVAAPMELIRAGVSFHARGLMNNRVIQQNLDWVWPYWVQRQFDPRDESFLPRSFLPTHVNLTHRNWTGLGLPGCLAMPIVDPRGLLTPLFDGWSVDAWVVLEQKRWLLPSETRDAEQVLDLDGETPAVRTTVRREDMTLSMRAWVEQTADGAVCRMDYTGAADAPGWLVVALRPFNPEGVQLVETIELTEDRQTWIVDDEARLQFDQPVEIHHGSAYDRGDVFDCLLRRPEQSNARCSVGLASGAAMFRLPEDGSRRVRCEINLDACESWTPESHAPRIARCSWADALAPAATFRVPDSTFNDLYQAALHSLVLLTPGDAYPGPYTYKRFWFRDATFLLHALLAVGLEDRARQSLAGFWGRQGMTGYFHSQQGEWDSNGEVLWLLHRFARLSGRPTDPARQSAVHRAADWILRKRVRDDPDIAHAGLLPAGFSAEHFGNNDYYYWDDFWAVAGLRSAAALCETWTQADRAARYRDEADDLLHCIDRSLRQTAAIRNTPGIPASPYRRMDSGAVGSLAAGYPLGVWPADRPELLATAEYLHRHCTVHGAFFQDMIHSGLNAYLSLHLAQVLLRADRPEYFDLVRAVAELASPTGQWPEAIHPRTGGGCMGDGHHGWASAEWLLMMRSLFVREDGEELILASGIPDVWLVPGETLEFGPTPTPHGPIRVRVLPDEDEVVVEWDGQWRHTPPSITVRLAGESVHVLDGDCRAAVSRRAISQGREPSR